MLFELILFMKFCFFLEIFNKLKNTMRFIKLHNSKHFFCKKVFPIK